MSKHKPLEGDQTWSCVQLALYFVWNLSGAENNNFHVRMSLNIGENVYELQTVMSTQNDNNNDN